MSVQTELTRISTAKTNIKNVVNSNTANTISNQKLDAFPPLINGTIAAQKGYIPWIKGEGKHLAFKNSKSGELDKFEMYGNTEQNQYNGKNLFNIDAVTGVTNGSINANKIIVTNAGTSTNYNVAPTFSTKTLYSGKTYYLSADIRRVSGEGTFGKMNDYVADWTAVTTPTLSTSYQRYTYKKTFSSDTNYYRILIQFRNTNNGVFEIKNIQISEVDNVYEPYCGGVAAPNPDYPQEVKVVNGNNTINIHGKNLFNKSTITSGKRIDPVGVPYTDENYSLSDYITIKSNTTYTRNLTPSAYQSIAFYTNDKTFISRSTNYSTITTPSDAYYVRFSMENANVDTAQLEEGSTATTYEPYQNQNYEIDLHGKNLLDKDSVILGKVWNGASNTKRAYGYIKAIQGQVYTASTQDTSSDLNIYITETAVIGTGDNHIKQTELTSTLTFTPQSATKYIVVQFTTTTNDITQEMVNNALIQIEKGSTATIYEPYYNYELCKVRDYKDEIKKSSEKNLLNIVNYDFAYIASNGNYNTDASHKNALFVDYIEVKPNTNYTASLNKNVNNFAISEYNSSKTFIQRTQFAYNISNGTIMTTANTKYLLISFNYDNSTAVNEGIINSLQFQLEEGDQTTTYEPYKNSWYIKKNINKIILDGSESWTTASSTDGNRFVCTTYNNAMIPSSTKDIGGLKSDKFIAISADNTANAVNGIAIAGSSRFTIYYANAKNYTSTEFKTWLSNNPITVYYIVENPEYLIITNETLISQLNAIETFEGINNISIENENNVLPDLLMITKNKDSYNNWKTKEGLN